MNNVTIDFNVSCGKIKPLHSMCCAPYAKKSGNKQAYIDKFFKAGNIPFCRLHDCCGSYGGTHFVDIGNVFPDFDADETNPESYDFHYTDEYIGAIQKTGCEAYYRLGNTIEWGSKKYTALPPRDFAKWARICEHIIMHYNCGWADGFKYNLTYWEIWNEPENPDDGFGKSQWTGTKEEFFELYRIASQHLKARFPGLKIGGYGSCGFYTISRNDAPAEYNEFVPFFTDFLKFAKVNSCPLDFYSWHIYTKDEKELLCHAEYVRKTLDDNGFSSTEAHLNEWNINAEGEGFKSKHTAEGASFTAAVMCMLQKTSFVDMAMYYCFSLSGMYNGLLDQNDHTTSTAWYSFEAFGNLYRLANSVYAESHNDGVYAVAAKSADESAALISNYDSTDSELLLHIDGAPRGKTVHVYFLDDARPLSEEFSFTASDKMDVKISLPANTVASVRIF